MLEATDNENAPWHIVRSDDKRRARLNVIAHFLSLIPYKEQADRVAGKRYEQQSDRHCAQRARPCQPRSAKSEKCRHVERSALIEKIEAIEHRFDLGASHRLREVAP
jgi:Polyphosphate kinase 2 (PPK2)